MPKKRTDLKVRVKRGEMTATEALDIMRKRRNWAQVCQSNTGRWMIRRANQ